MDEVTSGGVLLALFLVILSWGRSFEELLPPLTFFFSFFKHSQLFTHCGECVRLMQAGFLDELLAVCAAVAA